MKLPAVAVGDKSQHYSAGIRPGPLSLKDARWQVVPRVSVFLDALRRQRVQIATTVKVSVDFTNLQGLTRDEQIRRLRDLNARGDTIAATYLARRLYGCDLTQATHIVKGLIGAE